MFDHFWDFDRWSKMECQVELRSQDLTCFWAYGPNKGFTRVYVMAYGMLAHGFTHD
jgi:hypothetical protein